MTLIKLVLASLQTYFLYLSFLFPLQLHVKLKNDKRKFLWNNGKDSQGIHLVAWDLGGGLQT